MVLLSSCLFVLAYIGGILKKLALLLKASLGLNQLSSKTEGFEISVLLSGSWQKSSQL